MGNLTHTVSGDIASFRSAARVPIESLKCHFKPKQDLHGYDRPWPAGGGKNLLNIDVNNKIGNTNFMTYTTETTTGFNFGSTNGSGGYWVKVSPNTTYTYSYTSTYNGTRMHGRVWECAEKTTSWDIASANLIINKTSWPGSQTFTTSNDTNWIIVGAYAYSDGLNSSLTNMQIESGSTATSYAPYSNICPIEGWNNLEIYKRGKNLAQISGYNAQDTNNPDSHSNKTNSYGTSIDTNDYSLPDTPLVITQSDAPNSTLNSYKNGYVTIMIKNLQFGLRYDISFKVTNIVSNPLNAEIGNLTLTNPLGSFYYGTVVSDNIIIFKNVLFSRYTDDPTNAIYNRSSFSIRICGMSFTLSEFMVTPAGMNDGVFEPYCGNIIPITFPILGKNKFNWNVEQGHASPTSSDAATARTYPLNTYIIGMSSTNYYRDNYTNWVLNPSVSNGVISFESGAAAGYGIGFPLDLIPGQTYYLSGTVTNHGDASVIYYDKNGATISSQYYRLNRTITVPENTVISVIVFHANEPQTAYTFSNIQLELGDTATTYESYSSANTVYGGYIDIAKGELVETYASIILDGSSDEPWSTSGDSQTWSPETFVMHWDEPGILSTNPKIYDQCLCDSAIVSHNVHRDPQDVNGIHVSFYHYSNIGFHAPLGANATVSQLRAYLTEHPLHIISPYVKETRYKHYPLTPIQLKTFLDQNNIWSNTNDITEVSYQIHDSNMIHNAKLAMMAHSHDLPPSYQQYDYLRTSGSNTKIDTGVTGDDTTLQIECEFKFTQINNSYIGVFGNYKNENDAYCWRAILPNISTYPEPTFLYTTVGNGTAGNGNGLSSTMLIYSCRENNAIIPILNHKIKLYLSYGSCRSVSSTRDYTATVATKTADANTNNICLGAQSTTNTGGTTQCRIYSFKLYSQNHLVRNYVPCVRKLDSKAGFYDLVNHTFNPSIGSVEFVAGNEE